MAQEYPQIQNIVNQETKKFCSNKKERSKENCPSLGTKFFLTTFSFFFEQQKFRQNSYYFIGEFIALLSISGISWQQVSQPFLEELFCRNVLWVGNKYPGLMSTSGEAVDFDRLKKTWEATIISSRLVMFHVYFLLRVSRQISYSEIDHYYGRPSQKLTQVIFLYIYSENFLGIFATC